LSLSGPGAWGVVLGKIAKDDEVGCACYELPRTIPDVKMLLALAPEELGATILFLLKKRKETKFHTGNLQRELWAHSSAGQPQYPRQNENEINLALAEAWAWLQAQGLIVLDMKNGQYGWLVLSRRALAMESAADFKSFKAANLLPKEILHPKIADPPCRRSLTPACAWS
jgi:transcriptional regulator with XRE-family HTH domain